MTDNPETSAEGGFFARTEQLLGKDAFDAIRRARVAVFGLGGVGGWCAECLVRTGVRNVMLVDGDRVEASNVNRQLVATSATLGETKAGALAARLREICPSAAIDARAEFYDEGCAATFALDGFDYVVDAIDSLASKAALARHALSAPGTTLFSSMGAAKRTDPLKTRTADFWKVKGDGLARALRGRFRKDPLPGGRSFTCVYSEEPPQCDAMGSLAQVTAVFGMTLASLVVNDIAARCR